MTATPEADLKKLQEDFAQLRDDVAALAKSLKGVVCQESDLLGDAKDRIAEVRSDVERMVARGKKQVEEQPLASTATCFAIGLLLGMVFSKRH